MFNFSNKKKMRNKLEVEVALEKLRFLTKEFERGTSKETDEIHWIEAIETLRTYQNNFMFLEHAIEGYERVYISFETKLIIESKDAQLPISE